MGKKEKSKRSKSSRKKEKRSKSSKSKKSKKSKKEKNDISDHEIEKAELRRLRELEIEKQEAQRRAQEQKRLRKAIHLDNLLLKMASQNPTIDPALIESSINMARKNENEAKNSVISHIKEGMIIIPSHETSVDPVIAAIKTKFKYFEDTSSEYEHKVRIVAKIMEQSPSRIDKSINPETLLGIQESNSTGKIKQVTFRSKSKEEHAKDYK